jgi:hypothetical protein
VTWFPSANNLNSGTQLWNGPSVFVQSIDQNSNLITGYYTVLYENGNPVQTGYTPATFQIAGGQTYTVGVDNYGSCNFSIWNDTGSTNPERTFSVSSDSARFTAVYNCGGGGSTITITSEDQNGNTITGYYTTLTGNGQNQNGYTPVTFTGLIGDDSYSVDAENYGNCSFNHWGDTGSSNDPESILAFGQTVIAYYSCT